MLKVIIQKSPSTVGPRVVTITSDTTDTKTHLKPAALDKVPKEILVL